MRYWLIAAALLVGACKQQQAEAPAAPPEVAFDGALVKQAAAQVAHGDRLAWVLGCRGCHGKELQGERFYEVYASNLTRDLANYDDAALRRLLREGVHPSGREVWAMPSELFQHLSEADETALIAYLRTLQPAGPPTGKPLPLEPETKKLIAEGKIKPAADFVRETKGIGPPDLGDRYALGRYITRLTCAECHGPKLQGNLGDTPDLIVASGYSREEFERLLTTGAAPGGRKLKELMQDVARNRYSRLTPGERGALYAYLKARAEAQ